MQAAQQAAGNVAAQARAGDTEAFNARGAVSDSARRNALAEAMGAGQLAQGARGQDIEGAQAYAAAIEAMRGGDVNAANVMLQGRGMDDTRQNALLMAALGLGENQLAGGNADVNANLNAYQALTGFMLPNMNRTSALRASDPNNPSNVLRMGLGQGQQIGNQFADYYSGGQASRNSGSR
jgi:hypothetical protein